MPEQRHAEWLDVVNKYDKVIGRALRSDVHRRALYHRSTHILLFDSKQRVFVQLRSASKDTNPGLWDSSAAGHVDAGERYAACAARELREELGVAVQEQELLETDRFAPNPSSGYEFMRVYRCVSDAPITLEINEVADGRWVSPTELDHWLKKHPEQFTDTFATIWHNNRSR